MVALKREHGYEGRVQYWEWQGETQTYKPYEGLELYVTPDGLLYKGDFFHRPNPDGSVTREDYAFLKPFEMDSDDREGLLPGHRTDERAPYVCWRCHTDRVQCFSSDSYETSIRCPDCGTEMVVHDG